MPDEQLNSDKTEIIVFGPSVLTSGIVNQLGPLSCNVRDCVKNLVIFDPTLCFDKQISAVVKSSFFHLRSRPIARIKKMLSKEDLETLRLDYCYSLYLALPKSALDRLDWCCQIIDWH